DSEAGKPSQGSSPVGRWRRAFCAGSLPVRLPNPAAGSSSLLPATGPSARDRCRPERTTSPRSERTYCGTEGERKPLLPARLELRLGQKQLASLHPLVDWAPSRAPYSLLHVVSAASACTNSRRRCRALIRRLRFFLPPSAL